MGLAFNKVKCFEPYIKSKQVSYSLKILFLRNQENLTDFEFGGVEYYETTVMMSELSDNPAYTKYYTFITR